MKRKSALSGGEGNTARACGLDTQDQRFDLGGEVRIKLAGVIGGVARKLGGERVFAAACEEG